VTDLAIDELQHLFGRQIEQRVRAQRAADAPHDDRSARPWPTTSPTTIHKSPDGAVNTSYQSPPTISPSPAHSEPQAADRCTAAASWQQASLEQRCRRALYREAPSLDRSGDPIGDDLEQVDVVGAERTVLQAPDV
jgi:hypothetical protein